MAVNSLVCHVMLLLIHTWIIGVNGDDCNAVYQDIPTFKNCTYRCHCMNDGQCNETTGECGNSCELGWMGPGCQYRNIARQNSNTANMGPAVDDSDSGAKAVDGDVKTCSKTNITKWIGHQYWRIQWKNLYRIVGLIVKIHLDDVGNFNKFRVETGSGPNNEDFTSVCYTHGDTPGTTEMEIMCTQPVSTRHLRIIHDKRNVEMRVCEVEIYGGRAVTFNKYTNQSSTKSNRSSWLSVDGQAHISGVEANDTCSSTRKQMNPYWLVDFMTFYVVQSVYFYGGSKGLHPDYKEFKMFLQNASSDEIEIYNDTGTGYSMYQPMVIEQSIQTTARYLNISRPVMSDVLAICEVIAFAECPIHKCGWDCNTECYCAAETTGQYQIDGDCPYGCSGRWTGTEKKCNMECNATTWGQQCQNTCGNCNGTEPCNIVTGHCEHGCNGTLYPPDCTEECNDTAYGINCSQTCGHCKNNMRCNILTGNCTNGCMSGWKPPLCQEACVLGTFGDSCSKTCGHCHGSTTCNASTGVCKDGCDPGYYTTFCNTTCESGYYGVNCSEECGHCKDGSMCNATNGGCLQGCEPGWRTNTCKDTCEDFKYGEGCFRVCGNCYERKACNHQTGICTNGCAAGFKGDRCDQTCSPGKYGTNCNQTCGHCMNVSECDNERGMCSRGCMPGWNGSYCNMSCPAGYHGIDCQQHCGHCRDAETCNYVSGACTSCATGYRGATCSETCEEGSYGDNCTGTCGNCFEGNCIHTTGICINGCQAGFEGDLCNSECPSGKFGANCVQNCGYCMNLTECNKVTGFCTGSCSPGWIGSYCNESCMGGKYGQNCTDVCGNCSGEGTCNHTTGICTNGCISGFKGGHCKETCSPGEFGMNCSQSCGYCNDSIECSKETGFCSGGCLPGWIGSFCNESCKNGTYGENCSRLCGNCSEIGDCNHETGICAAGCVAGFQGKHCNTTCSAGTFGTNCAQRCGNCNSSTECNKETGHCSDSCKPGWNTSFCNESCAEGYFGFECNQLCGNCGDGEYCNPISGVCKSCDADYTGETCKQIKLKDSPPESSQAGTIAGVIVTVLVACGIGVAAVFVIRRRRSMGSKFRGSEMEHRIEFHNATVIADEMPDTEQSEDTVYKNAAIINSYIDVGDLRDVCATAKRNPQPFYNDFETLPYGLKKDASEARDPKYKSKNRYKEMYPYNANRVHLPMIPGDELSTYINASYINGYDIPQKYIAAQGALKTTISDVWRMVWTKTVSTIVMLTNCVELGKLKCAKYWPDEEAETEVHGDISVVLEKSDLFADFTVRTFLCTKVSSGEKRTVVQFHYTAWPDKDVPDTSLSLVQFWRAVRYNQSSKALPWLVHCSAGVGRTGTFIALDFLYDMGTLLGTVNILDAVNTLREQRLNMVQTKEQYVYVHEIAAEVLSPIGSVCQNDDFDELFQSLISVDGRATEKLKKEFEAINNYELEPDDEQDGIYSNITQSQSADAKLKENIGKSRDLKMIPKDLYRPQLSMVVIGRNDFINAVYVPTCRNRSELILTQIPLEHTVVDFLRLIWEYNVSIVVLLEEHMAEECSYYPSTTTLKQVDVFTTELRNEKKEECYVLRTIVISLKGRSEQRELKQFQIRSWPKDKPTPIDTGSMLKLISDIDNDGVSRGCAPIVVQCLDGAKKSGVFSTLWCLLVRQKSNNEIAVAETVRMSRVRRKQIIDNFEQYKYCYNVMRDYLDSFSVYANAI